MNGLEWFQEYPPEALPYEVGFILLAVSMLWYSMVLRRMVNIIHEKPVWILPLLGAGFVLASVAMHSFAYVVLMPRMDALKSVDEISQFSAFLLKWRAVSLSGILLGGLCSLLGGGWYYRSTTR